MMLLKLITGLGLVTALMAVSPVDHRSIATESGGRIGSAGMVVCGTMTANLDPGEYLPGERMASLLADCAPLQTCCATCCCCCDPRVEICCDGACTAFCASVCPCTQFPG